MTPATAFATAPSAPAPADRQPLATHREPVRPAPPSLNVLVALLHDVARRIGEDDPTARPLLRGLIAELQAHADPRSTALMVFAQALAARLADDGSVAQANLYLRRFEVPQITLFNLLGRHVPMVGMATRLANAVLARSMQGQAHPVLVDVGIGTGRQFVALLDDLGAQSRLPRELTVVGIEPAADALDQAGQALAEAAARHGVNLHFHAVPCSAEAMSDAQWAQVAALCHQAPSVNASFALHHIADDAQGQDQRDAVLRRLHALQPRELVLAEPDADHLEPRFFPRFRQCFAHFGAVFEVLDALPLQQSERDALKVGFFGREIHDVLATPEALRSERHESAASWLQRLQGTGYRLCEPGVALPESGHPAVTAEPRGPRVSLRGGGQSLVSIFVARPA